MDITITPKKLSGPITPPPSKSQAHRALIASALSGGGAVHNLADSDDIAATRRCLSSLLAPPPGELPAAAPPAEGGLPLLDCGASGSTLRFLIPLSLALRGGARFTGVVRLLERPLEPYNSAFKTSGILRTLEEKNPKTVQYSGVLKPGIFEFPGDISSQFVTGMLFALPLLPGDSKIMLTSNLESKGYVDMTLEVLGAYGIQVENQDYQCFRVPGNQTYRPTDFTVEADWSQAGFWYAAKGLGNPVNPMGLNAFSTQGDRCIEDYSRKLCEPGDLDLDVSQCPDLVPPLAAHAALRKGYRTHLTNAARLRLKESDRLDTVTTELCKLGAEVVQTPDSLEFQGVAALSGGEAQAHDDHRIAMMLAIAATRATGPVTIHGAESVAKSYPNFWEDYKSLGGEFI